MARPRMIVVAGPPGSGKSTYFPVTALRVDAFNIDDRCAQIQGSYRAISPEVRRAIAKECELFVTHHIEQGESFAVETTLRTTAAIDQAELARKQGFSTQLRFIATNSIEKNIARVIQRAQAGGHGASERDIRSIYEASIANLKIALRVFEYVRVYDSSETWAPPRLIATARDGQVVHRGATPAWLERVLPVGET
jgi:predicted ABC-type ATPase